MWLESRNTVGLIGAGVQDAARYVVIDPSHQELFENPVILQREQWLACLRHLLFSDGNKIGKVPRNDQDDMKEMTRMYSIIG